MQKAFDFDPSPKHKGMQAALDHAERVHHDWADQAFAFLENFVSSCATEFMAEDVREASKWIIPEPPSKRAWGALFNRAAIKGLIVRIGYRKVKNKKAHQTPAAVWKRK